MRQALYRVSGVDLTGIDAIGVENVQLVVSEYGPDLSKFPSEHEFVSHATLAPHQPTSGGKPTKNKRKRGSASSRVAGGLRMAATSLRHSQTALGAYYRRAAARNGADVAVFATARKLATLIYRLLRWGKPFWRYTPPPRNRRSRSQHSCPRPVPELPKLPAKSQTTKRVLIQPTEPKTDVLAQQFSGNPLALLARWQPVFGSPQWALKPAPRSEERDMSAGWIASIANGYRGSRDTRICMCCGADPNLTGIGFCHDLLPAFLEKRSRETREPA